MRSSVLVQKWRYFTLESGTESDFFSILGNCSWLLPATIAGTFRGKVVFGYIFENDFFSFINGVEFYFCLLNQKKLLYGKFICPNLFKTS